MTWRLAMVSTWFASAALAQVPAALESALIPSTAVGDVAIVTSPDAGLTRILGGDAVLNGLYVFDIDGGAAQLPLGLGLVSGVTANSGVVLASFANSFSALFGWSDAGVLVPIGKRPIPAGAGALALWRAPSGRLEAWIDQGTLRPLHVALVPDGASPELLDWEALDASVTFPRRPTSLVIDAAHRRMFAASTDGISSWAIDDPAGPVLLDAVVGGAVGAPPSDLTLYPVGDGGTLLLAAVPQRDDFVVFRVDGAALTALGRFQVTMGPRLVRNVQFLDVSAAPVLGFPTGLLVVSDRNTASGSNYKYVSWAAVAEAFSPPLPIATPTDQPDAGEALEDCLDEPLPPDAGAGDAGVDGGLDASVGDAGSPGDGGSDGGLTDGGHTDGGLTDAGALDAGTLDGGRKPCRRDAGVSTRRDGGSSSGPGGFEPETPTGCCTRGPTGILFPGALLGIWAVAFRRRPHR